MTNHVLLDNISHQDLRVKSRYEKNHGYDVSLTRTFLVEFSQLQMEYPILFTKNQDTGHFEPMAMLGFSENENLYLGNGKWDASYIPLTIQRQPFLIGFQETVDAGIPSRNPVVHIDLDHPSVSSSGEGERIFLEHGGESPVLERMSSILMTIHNGHEINQSFSKLLVGLDLIESLALEIEFNDGSKQNLKGLYTINEDKLRALNANALEVLHTKGHLQDVYMILASLPNLARLIEKKNQQLT
ncbi:MAG: hypothetical protein ACI9H8_000979 [Lysobacterales bacterium]|jgi:hypothetical protein